MSLIKYFVKNHVLVNMITIAVLVFGVAYTMKLNREVFPSVDVGYIVITTTYPGASPKEVETVVTTPIEEEIAGVDGIDTLESESREGMSVITIKAQRDVEGAALDQLQNDLKNEVDKAKKDFPSDVDDPQYEKFAASFSVVTISISGDVPEKTLRDASERLKTKIEAIDGVDSVDRFGYRDREMWVSVDPRRLEATNLSLSDVISAIKNRNLNTPGGTIDEGRKEFLIRSIGEVEGAAEVEDVVIKSLPNGEIKVGDIAEVTDTFKKWEVKGRIDGKPSINLMVKKKTGGDVITIVGEIKKLVAEEKKILPEGAKIDLVRDQTKSVETRQNRLLLDVTIGLFMVLLIMYLFLETGVAIWSAASIPFSFLLSLAVMYFMGITLNILSMFGLMLVLGMVVDQAIVVAENSFRYREMGLSTEDAVITGTHEVILPVAAAVTTHIASLLPIMFTAGIMGKFLKVIPEVGIICFLAAWFQAFFVLPSNLNQFVKVSIKEKKEDFRSWFTQVRNYYGRLLSYCLKRRYLIFISLIAIAVGAMIFGFSTMEFVWMGKSTTEKFNIIVKNPVNVNLNETDRVVKRVEKLVEGLPSDEIASFVTNIGSAEESHRSEDGTYLGQIYVELTKKGYTESNPDEIINALREKTKLIPGPTSITVEKEQEGPPTGKPVSVEVKGEDFAIMEKLSMEVVDELKKTKGVKDIQANYRKGKEEIKIEMDEHKIRALGLNVATVSSEIRSAFSGGNAGVIRRGDEKIDIIVKFSDSFQKPSYLLNLSVPNSGGERIPIKSFADIVYGEGVFKIYHSDRKRTITVTAEVIPDENTSAGINKALMKKFGTASAIYPGYFYDYTGEFKDTQESLVSMIEALWLVLGMIYMILAVLFRSFVQPIIIMMAIPFAFIGAFFGLFIMGEQLSLFAFIGIIALMGIVVSNSILLLDFINRARTSGSSPLDAVKESGMIRLRPILLTSITIVMGLFPVAFGIGGRESMIAPMAIAMFWGVLFSTLLTLFAVPCLYIIVEDIKKHVPVSLGGYK
jgi:multidrug efflux pump subunit AcrB